jgi:PAS domain S-box-containing protein
MRRFVPAAIGAAALLAAIAACLVLQPGGATVVETVRTAGQIVSTLAAFAACVVLARGSSGGSRRAWTLLAASAGCAFAGQLIDAAYVVRLSYEPVFPSGADFGFLAAVPLAITGLFAFPADPSQFATRRRAVLDLAMVALSLTFISGALSLPQAYLQANASPTWWVGPAFPLADVAVITAIFVSLRRSLGSEGGRLVLVVCGLAINAVSDSAAAFLSSSGTLPALANLFGVGTIYGYTLIALSPLWPQSNQKTPAREMAVWQDLVPYFGLVAVAVTAVAMWLANRHMSPYVALPAAGLGVILLASQLLSRAEARSLLKQSRRAEAMDREREILLHNLIDHAPQGVACITADRRITSANPRLASMLYSPLPVLIGSTTDAFLPESYVSWVFKSFIAAEGSTPPETYESDSQARRGDGTEFWVHWSLTAIHKQDRTIDYFLAMFQDVTAKREAEETAVANLAQLEKLSRLKSEFVSMVSHEFRTALVGIQGFSELIRDQELEVKEIKVLAEEIYNDAQRVGRMITEMLDFDRLEAGKIRLDLQPVDVNELVDAAVERAAVSSPKHVVNTKLQAGLPAVLGDADRLTQVLTNLLSNAIKYSPLGGEVCVSTRLTGGAVEVSITDHGKGIPPEFISRLFGRYERYEDKHAGKIIGTGLGLAITRQIVEMHGGKISVDSVVGSGSEFRFTVPLAVTSGATARSA